MTTPKIVAHRGFATQYPENTIEAFSAAIERGVVHIELDVQLSGDRVPVIIHDDNMERTAGVALSVIDMPVGVLSQYTVGEAARLGDVFSSAKLPRLVNLVTLLEAHPQVTAYVELKDESLERFGVEQMVDICIEALRPVISQVVIISYNDSCLEYVRTCAGCPIGWVLSRWDDESRQLAERLSPNILICNYKKINNELWQGPWSWFLYEIADPELALNWIDQGVEYIETMDIEALLDRLPNQGS